tara:strand:- start:3370 stop:4464 length:1095 start_codon:yes stop_codon:yes gene_type:complete
MHKRWSLNMGQVAGIKVFIHWTFFILIGWIFLMHFKMGHGVREGLSGMIFILALFGCVVLHEFGHSLTARRFGIPTKDITIYPIGGIASLESMPAKPSRELQVALAGPAVNIVIAAVLWAYLKSSGQTFDFRAMQDIELTGASFVPNLMYANLVLAAFNLIPAFPMDGGRVLRSLLAMKLEPVIATSIAAKTGQFLAIVFVFFGFFFNFWMVFIGLFIFLGAGAESKAEEIKKALESISVTNIMKSNYGILNPDMTLHMAARHFLNSKEKSFLVMKNDKVLGILSYKDIVVGLRKGKGDQEIEAFMQKDFQWLKKEEYLSDKFFLMLQGRQALFPVRDNGKLVGIVNSDEIHKWIQTKPYVFNN